MTSAGVAIRLTGVGVRQIDRTGHRDNRRRGRDGWDDEAGFTRELVDAFTRAVGDALEQCGVPASRRREIEIVTATCYGTAHVAEVMHERLRLAGRRWLDPESFIYYAPHSLTSAAAMTHGIGGAGCTTVGLDAGAQALAHAARRLRAGRVDRVLVCGYEAITSFAKAALKTLDVPGSDVTGEAVALMLETGPADGPTVFVRRGLSDPGDVRAVIDAHAPEGPATVWTTSELSDLAESITDAKVVTVTVPAAGPATVPLLATAEAVARTGPGQCAVVLAGTRDAVDVVLVNS